LDGVSACGSFSFFNLVHISRVTLRHDMINDVRDARRSAMVLVGMVFGGVVIYMVSNLGSRGGGKCVRDLLCSTDFMGTAMEWMVRYWVRDLDYLGANS